MRRFHLFTFLPFHLFVFSLLLAACSLDEEPRDQIPEEEAYTTPKALYLNTVALLYNYIGGATDGQGLQGTCRGIYDLQTFGADEAFLPKRGGDWYDGGLWQAMYCHSWDAGNEIVKNAWLYLYKVITLCNRSLEILSRYQNEGRLDIDSSTYADWQAEIRALRAIYFWQLIDLFGGVPMITTTDVSIADMEISTRRDVYIFILKELTQAVPRLSLGNSTSPGEFYGRVTRGVAYFVLAKLMLNAEVYLDTDPTDDQLVDGSQINFSIDNETVNAWEAAVYYCTELEAMGYRLEDDYEANFSVYNENSRENIWTIPMDKYLYTNQMQYMFRSWHYLHAAAYGFSAENGTCATPHALASFFSTGRIDSRFYANFYSGTVIVDNKVVTDRTGQPLFYYPEDADIDVSNKPFVETAGARMKKYEVDRNALKDGKLIDNDIVLFRYADVKLMRAEALIRNGQSGQADYDDVRTRAHMELRQATLDNLLEERLMELFWEGWRRQDLIRFGRYHSLYQGNDAVDESDGHTTVFPIPADVINTSPNLKQNPGY